MEFKRDSTSDELQSFEPQEWPNIPRPIIISFAIIRKALLNNENSLSKLKQQIHHVDVKDETHFNELMKAFSMTHEMIVSSESNSKEFTSQKEAGLLNIIAKLEKRLKKEEEIKLKEKDESDVKFNAKLEEIHKRIDELPTYGILDNLIEEMKEKLKDKLKQEVKDTLLNPEIYMMSQRLRLVNS